ncbi:DEAD/DEAH box helicase [Desulfomicrobium salsuginis]
MSFESLGLPIPLVQALAARGLREPLPVQEAALPALAAGNSAMLISRTGSGKTLAYLLPILAGIDPQSPHVQAVILAPTHELAMQINRVAKELSAEAGLGIRVQALIGGAAASRQIEGLKKKPHIVVGSAGRITHLLDLGKLKLRDTAWLVLDEADRLLIEEGLEHVRHITGELGPQTRFVFVSATEGPATTRIAKGLAPDLKFVRVQASISPTIRHCYLVCEERDKIEWLRKALRGLEPNRALVFVHRGASAERISERLDYHQLAVADLHGARDKFERQAALDSFRRGKARVLIASDIAARGLDIADVELVVNLDAPSQSRDYLHRAGRTGRAGAAGLVLTLLTEPETRLARRYAEELDIAMEPVRMVRGALAPSDASGAQPLAPAPRKRGPAAPGSPRTPGKAQTTRKSEPSVPKSGKGPRRPEARHGESADKQQQNPNQKSGGQAKPTARRSDADRPSSPSSRKPAQAGRPAGSPPARRPKSKKPA